MQPRWRSASCVGDISNWFRLGRYPAGGINFDATLIVNNTGFNTTTLTRTAANCSYYALYSTGMNGNASAATLRSFFARLFGNGSNASFDLSGGYDNDPAKTGQPLPVAKLLTAIPGQPQYKRQRLVG